jgi:hypothetical protein
MENIINTFRMILCSYASSICVSLSKSMMFASLLVLRATHVGLGGWLLCSQQHEGKLRSRRLPVGIPLANRRSVREHYRCLILANTLTISALTVRQCPPVATEHDCREIPLRSVDKMRHWRLSVPSTPSLSTYIPLKTPPAPYRPCWVRRHPHCLRPCPREQANTSPGNLENGRPPTT